MRILIGTDIIEVDRIKKALKNENEKFKNRVYTEKEIEYCESKGIQKFQSYAARFAAKEAIYKALSSYIKSDYKWTDFEVINEPNGRPRVKLHIDIKELENIDISLSHCKEYAVAYVTVQVEE